MSNLPMSSSLELDTARYAIRAADGSEQLPPSVYERAIGNDR
jgi:hypothetical protein